jgi:hypothetical protein
MDPWIQKIGILAAGHHQFYMFAASAVPTAETAYHGIKWGLVSYLTQKDQGKQANAS